MDAFETYLRELYEIRSTGAAVKETSYYPALSNLLNTVGKDRQFKPRVRCVMTLKNQGAGMPDGGLFTRDQFQRASDVEPLQGQMPSRGAIEVKGAGEDAWATADSEQVSRYLARYRQVLVTNYREFVLVGKDRKGMIQKRESYRLAGTERNFWGAAARPREAAKQHGERFLEFMKRVMLHGASIATPEDLAWFLASYARDAKSRIEGIDLPALQGVRTAMEEALGIAFQDERGDHFFRSSLIQTLFYGVFAAWVLWSKENPPVSDARFSWREAEWSLQVPMIRALFEQIATPSKLGPLDLVQVLDWTADVLNRVDRASFFSSFQEGQAVQYFYEPFLEAFDPELRKQLGVWYTPVEIVQYQVERVDRVLRDDLGLVDGLADPNVFVLDPCCGTGAYLVAALKKIAETLASNGGDALVAADLKEAARTRIAGFELLPAPFVVSHLQLGLTLQSLKAPLADDGSERVAVYLTNALTGWEPPEDLKTLLPFPELAEERDAANKIKQESPVIVILGNPPYHGYAGIAIGEERLLSTAYRTARRAPAPEGQGLNDLFVRFFRMAERKIVEQTGRGIVCFITNSSWLDRGSHPGMRERYLEAFDKIWIDNLHGNRIISERTPEGESSETIFAIAGTSSGIEVGAAISLLMRNTPAETADATVYYRDMHEARAADRRAALTASLRRDLNAEYERIEPEAKLGFPFTRTVAKASYLSWPMIPELFPQSFPGVTTARDALVVDIDMDVLENRMRKYFDPAVTDAEMRRICPAAVSQSKSFDGPRTRRLLMARGFKRAQICPFAYRPFDTQWLYWERETKLLDRKREDYIPHVFDGNVWFTSTRRVRKGEFYRTLVTTALVDYHLYENNAAAFPLYLKIKDSLFNGQEDREYDPNLSKLAKEYLADRHLDEHSLFHHTVAILHSPEYASDHQGPLRQDWPRIPLPEDEKLLSQSAALGRQVAALLNLEEPLVGISSGSLRAELKGLGKISKEGGGQLEELSDLVVAAGWGRRNRSGIGSGKGRFRVRDYSPEERALIVQGGKELGFDAGVVFEVLGQQTCDLYLNDVAYWKNVPEKVFSYTLGGYQVLKKWLSYREHSFLQRPMRRQEVRLVTQIVRRIAAILLLTPLLDNNYASVSASCFSWGEEDG